MSKDIDMRQFARSAGTNVTFPSGSVVFNKGDPGICMYIVQSGMIEMTIGDTVIETVGPNEAIGFMSMIDGAARSSNSPRSRPISGAGSGPDRGAVRGIGGSSVELGSSGSVPRATSSHTPSRRAPTPSSA